MENLTYTKAEAFLIDDAFRAIRYGCDTWSWSATPSLDGALKAFREGARRPIREAKAHTVGAFLRGLAAGATITAADLFGLAPGYVAAVILGAGYATRNTVTPETMADLRAALEAANVAQDAALQRFLERIRNA